MGRRRTVGGSVFIPLHFPGWCRATLVPLLGWFRTVLVCSLYGAVAAAIFRIITALGVFVVQGWTGDMAAGVEWSGPTWDH